jgi:uncharacterized protein YjeT (DUF2065 family)
MDLSKLPKLSQTPPPPDNAAGPDPATAPAASPGTNPAAPKVELFCRCGAPITPGTNFCSHCGANYYEAVGGRGDSRPRDAGAGPGGGMWIEAFFSIAVGLFLIMIAPEGIKYLGAKMSGKAYTPYLHPSEPGVYVDYLRYTDSATGAIIDYHYRYTFNMYWKDMSVTAFALALILEGIVLAFVRKRWAVLASALLIAAVTILNLWYVVASFTRTDPTTGQAYGFYPLSALAFIFGVVMVGYQWMLFNELSPGRRRK